jgi:hypothetical protein
MVKRMPVTPRAAARRTVKTDVVTRVSAHDVSRRAYELFQERGSEHGHDLEDWLRAEAALLVGSSAGAARPSADIQRRRP